MSRKNAFEKLSRKLRCKGNTFFGITKYFGAFFNKKINFAKSYFTKCTCCGNLRLDNATTDDQTVLVHD